MYAFAYLVSQIHRRAQMTTTLDPGWGVTARAAPLQYQTMRLKLPSFLLQAQVVRRLTDLWRTLSYRRRRGSILYDLWYLRRRRDKAISKKTLWTLSTSHQVQLLQKMIGDLEAISQDGELSCVSGSFETLNCVWCSSKYIKRHYLLMASP